MGMKPLICWECRFESCQGVQMWVLCIVRYEVSARGWTLLWRSLTERGVYTWVWSQNLNSGEALAQ